MHACARPFLLTAAAVALFAGATSLATAGVRPAGAAAPPAAAALTPVIPRPAAVRAGDGAFVLDAGTRWYAPAGDARAQRVAQDFVARLQRSRRLALARTPRAGRGTLQFAIDPGAPVEHAEGYALDVAREGVRVRARSEAGLFYGAVTLWQLATADGGRGAAPLHAQSIEDAPRFAWRGLMLDVARHFRSVEEVKAVIDQMALHKLNTLHWHLTDDQGWRIQIKRYPILTEIGGCRIPAGAAGRDADGSPKPYCGFYTQEQIREVVGYAAQRHVTVVPEIDLPGHAQAAIAAYPALGVTGATPPVSPDWGVHTWLFNVDDGTFAFLEGVLDEVVALFPSRYVHLGGDEAVKDQWIASAAVQAKRRALGLKDEMQLQGWFMDRLGRHLATHGRRMVGWDEILEGAPPADATVMSWRGTAGAVEAARNGHDVVLSPAPDLYLDHIQSDGPDETGGRLKVVALRDVYAFEPVPKELDAAQAARVLGAQANVWSEHQRTSARVQRAAFPRAAALAEATWTPAARRDYADFLARLAPMFDRYRAAGFEAADSAFAVRLASERAGPDRARVSLSSQEDLGTLRYTLDGRAPTPASPAYTAPLTLALPATVTAARFDGARALSAPRTFALDAGSVRSRGSHALASCKGGLTLRMEDDAPAEPGGEDSTRALLLADVFDPCWRYPQADLDGASTLAVRVGQLPFNFQLWRDATQVVTRPAPPSGAALEVRADRCDGDPLLRLPLAPALGHDGLTELQAPLPPGLSGRRDLCFVFASGRHDPMWVIDEVALRP